MKSSPPGAVFRFRKNENIGTADAEFDDRFIDQCYVDSGYLEVLRDCRDSKRIIVGRTGAGKSALIRRLNALESNVISLAPENLALNFLANSEVIRFFEAAGTNLDVFYQLLWRHVLVVELIKFRYNIRNEEAQRNFLSTLAQVFSKDKAKERALSYLRGWGETFWNETEYRIKEITSKIENELKSSLEGTALVTKMSASGASKLSDEEKKEVVSRGARVVSAVQIKELADVIRLLAEEIFTDPLDRYYVSIDDLDTRWVEDSLKYKLIRALIETVKTFRQIQNVKVVVSLRLDLIQRVIEATRDSGFQSEKYEPLILSIRWSSAEIMDILRRRLKALVSERYTTRSIPLEELFPTHIGKASFSDFVAERTFLRPRDAILLINECLERAAERSQVTAQIVADAEAAYSAKRVDSLQEEWGSIYPKVGIYLEALARRQSRFRLSELSEPSLRAWVENRLLASGAPGDPIAMAAEKSFLQGDLSFQQFQLALVEALYVVGVIGIKPDTTTETYWSYFSTHKINISAIRPNATIYIHATFWRFLGVKPN